MRQTLLYIPHELAGIPIFGMGWALGVWLLFSAVLLTVLYRRYGWTSEVKGYLPLLGVVAAALYALFPMIEVQPVGMAPLGLPIRGYGVFVVAGIFAGMGLSVYRAKQVKLDPDLIFSLAFWMFVLAIPGARAFYVIQKWDEFHQDTLMKTVAAILKFTEGGLVVYGSVIGALLGLYLFSRKHRISVFKLGDIIAPGMAIGLALGRIGCLMNGCCYGGMCANWPVAITFPKYAAAELKQYSAPYTHQLLRGELHGFRLGEDSSGKPVVMSVHPGSKAEAAGLKAGAVVRRIDRTPVENLKEAQELLARGQASITINNVGWLIDGLPDRSLPIHPTQIYSSINAALLCFVLWFAYPYRRRDGDVILLLLGLYSITRFLLEAIRIDEAGQLGTLLTISQLVSIATLAGSATIWLMLRRQPIRSQTASV